MKLTQIIALIATTGMFFTGQVYAQEAPATSKAEHAMKADTDQDGKISRDEFRAAQEARGDKRFQRRARRPLSRRERPSSNSRSR